MINYTKTLYFLASVIILLGCMPVQEIAASPEGKRPDWIDNPSKLYPENEYLTGIGSGSTRKEAENDAFASLAKIFSVEIKVNQSTINRYLEEDVEGQNKSTFSSLLAGRTSARSNQKIKNVKIARTFFSDKEGVYYVLAVLDRAETAALYKDEIRRNGDKIDTYYQRYQESGKKLQQLNFINKTIALTQMNHLLSEQYKIISSRKGWAPTVTESELNAQRLELLDKISVSIVAESKAVPEVASYLKEAVSEIGFKVKDGAADFAVKYNFNTEKSSLLRENTAVLNWHLNIDLRDNVNQKAIGAFNTNKRSVGISEQAAQLKMMRSVHKVVLIKFKKQFNKYLNSL